MIAIFEKYFFWLMVYSIIGWIYESLLCSISERQLINRGFLNGPYCPIYGAGAVLDILLLGRFQNIILLFFLGVLLTCSLEYITSVVLEKMFHAKWWDYSDRKFNINGRVCLIGAVAFGAFSVVLIKYLHPFVVQCIDQIPILIYRIITALLFLIFVTDSAITISGFSSFNNKLKELTTNLDQKKEYMTGKIINTTDSVSDIYEPFKTVFNKQQWRMIMAFPKLRSIRYNPGLIEFRNYKIRNKRKR